MKKIIMRLNTMMIGVTLLCSAGTPAAAVQITELVDGTSNTLLIGEIPPGSDQGTLPPWIGQGGDGSSLVVAGTRLRISASGMVTTANNQNYSPDGGASTVNIGFHNSLSGIEAPLNSLEGVFTDGGFNSPAGSPPPRLTITDGTSNTLVISEDSTRTLLSDFSAPLLWQRFFIGDGSIIDGTSNTILLQEFVVPENATRLYFGVIGGGDWSQSGSYTLDIGTVPLPEPATLLLLGIGLIGLSGIARKKNEILIRGKIRGAL